MTSIEWTDEVWNPVTGCTKVSSGCKNCYAERIAGRKMPHGGFTDRPFTEVRCHPERLGIPLHWKKPRRIFVNSMSDLFHESVPASFIDQVFAVMALAPQHTFQILTKRPKRMQIYMTADSGARVWVMVKEKIPCFTFPSPNVWLGVSVEDQRTADERIPLLLQTPAAVRFLSCEPLLGPIDLTLAMTAKKNGELVEDEDGAPFMPIDWVIAGGESGPGARPCDIGWIRSIVRQGKAAGVPVFVKQLGAVPIFEERDVKKLSIRKMQDDGTYRFDNRKGGDPSEWPEDLRVREFPR